MKTYFTILGCGSSVGVPRIDGFWGNCDKNEKKNFRSRCSAVIVRGDNVILIDTSPDLKHQLISNKIKKISSVIYSHEHADQTNGLFELRPFYWRNKKKINIYGNNFTIRDLKKRYNYLFKTYNSYPAIVKSNIIKKKFSLGKNEKKIFFNTIDSMHGKTRSIIYIFEKTAYASDCNDLSIVNHKCLANLNYLIIDCLKFSKHPSHFNLKESIFLHFKLKPKTTILTNLHYDLDYKKLLNKLPKGMVPAYDGLKIML